MIKNDYAAEVKRKRNRMEYQKRKEQKKDYMRKYYAKNKGNILESQKQRRHLTKLTAGSAVNEQWVPMNTRQLEAFLPTLMQKRLPTIRREYLSIPIQERMLISYDYFLRLKEIDHLKERNEKYGAH